VNFSRLKTFFRAFVFVDISDAFEALRPKKRLRHISWRGVPEKFNNTLACQRSVFVAIKRPDWRNYLRFASALAGLCIVKLSRSMLEPPFITALRAPRELVPKKVIFVAEAYLC
jgi:hypothetical protein